MLWLIVGALAMATPVLLRAQAQGPAPILAIAPPVTPIPFEADSRDVTRFSFVVYGDTRGRRDGEAVQYEHSLLVDSMLQQISRLRTTAYPVRFILQSGDAVVAGSDARQWNVSFVPLINRLTTEGGVPYFLVPGNHDVSGASTADASERQPGLHNYFRRHGGATPAQPVAAPTDRLSGVRVRVRQHLRPRTGQQYR